MALLAKRARFALWAVVASNAFFAITDLRLAGDAMVQVLGLKLLQLGTVALGLWALRSVHSRDSIVMIVLISAASIAALTAWSGAVADDIVTTMILWIAVPFAATALLPWGMRAQLGLVVIAGLAMLLNLYLARGTLALAISYPAVGVVVSLGVSVALAREFEWHRRALLAEVLRQRENVMNTVPDIIYTIDCNGCMRDWNRRLEIVSGRPAEAIAGRPAVEMFEAAHRARIAAGIEQALTTGYAQVEANMLVPGGVRLYQFTGVPLRDEAGAVLGLTGVGRDIAELKQLQERTATLLEIARDVSGQLNLHEILERVQRRAAAVLPCDMVATFYWDAEQQGFRAVSHYGVPPAFHAALEAIKFGPTAPFDGRVAAGDTVMVDDLSHVPGLGSLPRGVLIAAPLRVRGRHLGALVAMKGGHEPFEPGQVSLCEGIAVQLAVALEAAELYRTQREEVHVSSALASVGKALIASRETTHVFEDLCRHTGDALECDSSFVLRWQPAEHAYVVAAGHGFSEEHWESLRSLRLPALPRSASGGNVTVETHWPRHHTAGLLRARSSPRDGGARGSEPFEVRVSRHDVARATHAAQHHARLQ